VLASVMVIFMVVVVCSQRAFAEEPRLSVETAMVENMEAAMQPDALRAEIRRLQALNDEQSLRIAEHDAIMTDLMAAPASTRTDIIKHIYRTDSRICDENGQCLGQGETEIATDIAGINTGYGSVSVPLSPQCYKHDKRYTGGVLQTGVNVSSAESCQALCQDHAECSFFTMAMFAQSPTASPTASQTASQTASPTASPTARICMAWCNQEQYGTWESKCSSFIKCAGCEACVASIGTCTLHDNSCSLETAEGHVSGTAMRTGTDIGAAARLNQVDCESSPGRLDSKYLQTRCIVENATRTTTNATTCKQYFGDPIACPDGIIQTTGVGLIGTDGRFIKCAAWNSHAAAAGWMGCTDDGNLCTKMEVRKFTGMSQSAGVFMMKRMICSGDSCNVFKSGRCFDVGEDMFSNLFGTNPVEQNQAFATKVLEGLEAGLPMSCSTEPKDNQVFDWGNRIDSEIAKGAIKIF